MSLDEQVLADRQMAGAIAAAGRWPEDTDWPSVPAARGLFLTDLYADPDPPASADSLHQFFGQLPASAIALTPAQRDRNELQQVLGVGRHGR